MSLIFLDICGYSTENEAEKMSSYWLTLRQNLLKSSQTAEFIDFRQGKFSVHVDVAERTTSRVDL